MQTQIVVSWLTIAGSLGIGSSVGSFIALYFTVKESRKDWVKDNKKQEWRELISTLSQSFHYYKDHAPVYATVVRGEEEKALLEADAEARRAIESRIFIADQIQRENVLERWQLLAAEKDWSRMVEYWDSLHSSLLVAAHKDLGIEDTALAAK